MRKREGFTVYSTDELDIWIRRRGLSAPRGAGSRDRESI
jgi:hypothetical protein